MARPVTASSARHAMPLPGRSPDNGHHPDAPPLGPNRRHHHQAAPPPQGPERGSRQAHGQLPCLRLLGGIHRPRPSAHGDAPASAPLPLLRLRPLLRRDASTPAHGPSPPCLVAAVADSGNSTRIHICRPREPILNDNNIDQAADQYWAASAPLGAEIHDLIFHKGDLYCICEGARVFAFDLLLPSSNIDGSSIFTCPTPRCVSEGREEERHNRRDIGEASYFVHYYLVNQSNCSGRGDGDDQLLAVTQYIQRRVYSGVHKIVFDLHRLEVGTGAMARVEDLGDAMLFVGRACSRSWFGREPPNQTFFRKGCIYFAHLRYHPQFRFRLGRFCFPSGSGEQQHQQLGRSSFAEFLPDLFPTTSNPLWMAPSPT